MGSIYPAINELHSTSLEVSDAEFQRPGNQSTNSPALESAKPLEVAGPIFVFLRGSGELVVSLRENALADFSVSGQVPADAVWSITDEDGTRILVKSADRISIVGPFIPDSINEEGTLPYVVATFSE